MLGQYQRWECILGFALALSGVMGCGGDTKTDASSDAVSDTVADAGRDAGLPTRPDAVVDTEGATEEEKTGFEILEIQSPSSILAWISPQITRSEFDALEVPTGWLKNQPRESFECGADEVRFIKSPDGAEDGDIMTAEHFGFIWFHAATIVQSSVPVDAGGVLTGVMVKKYHELVYNPGTCMVLLVSPEGDIYVRVGRDANRRSDTPTIPDGWTLEDYTPTEAIVIQLFEQNLVIRTDNQDSFQGPVPQLKGVF